MTSVRPNCVQVLVQALGRFVSEVIKEEMNKVLQAGSKEAKTMTGRPLVKPSVKGAKTKKLTAAALHAMQVRVRAWVQEVGVGVVGEDLCAVAVDGEQLCAVLLCALLLFLVV